MGRGKEKEMTRRGFVKGVALGVSVVAGSSSQPYNLGQTKDAGKEQATGATDTSGTISSIRGSISPLSLGTTLMHEHVVWLTPGIRENWPDYFDEKACLETANRKFKELASRGIRTLVDLTPPNGGRNIGILKRIQDATSINIIACTGMYYDIPIFWQFKDADEMAAAFIKDIKKGMQGSEIKAGIIKLATDRNGGGLNPENEKCLRAGARAHRATGVPISTHTGPPSLGLEQQRVFREEGVDLSRVIIGHIGDSRDTDFQKRLMDQGSTIGMDRFGIYVGEITFEKRVETVAKLCKDGYADRMVLSHDHWCWHDWDFAKRYPGYPWKQHTYTHIPDDVLPALRERGISEAQIEQMLARNPRRIFGIQGAY
jgi:phosphotriesterase-related protein